MTHRLLKLTLVSGLVLGATSLSAQTQFPLSKSQDFYAAPVTGVVLLSEGRSAFAVPRAGEFSSKLYDFARQIDYQTAPSEQYLPSD